MAAVRPITTGFHSLLLACRQGGINSGNANFPIAFPSVCLAVSAVTTSHSNGATGILGSYNKSTFTFYLRTRDGSEWVAPSTYIAAGY